VTAPTTTAKMTPSTNPTLLRELTLLAQTEAAAMSPQGSPQSAKFRQGDVLVVPVTLAPSQCLTALGVSSGIQELDMQLLISLPGAGIPPTALAVDTSTGSTARIGGGGNCMKNPLPLPMPAVLVLRATAGSGEAMVQTFVK